MTPEAILEKIRSHPRLVVVEDFELAVEKGTRQLTKFRCGRCLLEEREDFTWVSLRLVHRRQPGRAVMAVESPDAIPLLIENAFAASQLSSPDPWFRFPLWRALPDSSPAPLTEATEQTSEYDRQVFGTAELEETYERLSIERCLFRKTERRRLKAAHEINAGRIQIRKGEVTREWVLPEGAKASDFVTAFERATERLAWEGEAPQRILFRPEAATALLEELAVDFHGDRILEGAGALGSPKDEKIFDPKISIIDDGTQSWPFDMEGSPTQQTRLVEAGRYRAMLLDCHAAARDNRLSTGNFVKETPWDWPHVGPTRFFIQNGATSFMHLLSQMGDGVLLEQVKQDATGAWWGEGWEVRGGALKRPYHLIPLPCSLREALTTELEIGNDLTFYGRWGSPSILCLDLPLSARQNHVEEPVATP